MILLYRYTTGIWRDSAVALLQDSTFHTDVFFEDAATHFNSCKCLFLTWTCSSEQSIDERDALLAES